MGETLDGLIDLLDLEQIEENIFRGQQPDEERQRVFGGQVAGQALVAATRTVERDPRSEGRSGLRQVHSLHAYFLRPGDPSIPILYDVDRIRDGRSFTTRRVVGIQHGRAIFNLAASFHHAEDGLDFSVEAPPDTPGPESLPTFAERYEKYADQLGAWYSQPRPIDMRYVDAPFPDADPSGAPQTSQRVWMRADGALPDDTTLHACIVTYASDMTLLDTTLLPHRIRWTDHNDIQMASLDHAMWFHRAFRADEWLLYVQDTPSTSSSRGLARGMIFRQDGALAISVVQEGLIRVMR
ncbi:MAG: acyl-CoA thioesterase [Actinomycetota bacterium]|jgi:acyl-CoA thioesterase-2|nr:acyl-CoA thioesterase [Actinomycetota bacterium]